MMRSQPVVAAIAMIAVVHAQSASPGASAKGPAVMVQRIGAVASPYPLYGAPVFALREDAVEGALLEQGYAIAFVQLLTRPPGGRWSVAPGSVAVARPRTNSAPAPWSLPLRSSGCAEGALEAVEIMAAMSRNRLPSGPIEDTPVWNRIVARSEPVRVSCVSFARSRLAVESVGQRRVKPHDHLPVAQFEDVVVRVEDAPPGSLVQLCVTPNDNAGRRWCMPGVYAATGSEWIGTAYFGRPDIVRIANRLTFRDTYTRFWLQAYIVRSPLPVRENDGIGPAEWLALQRLVAVQSEPVEVVRAFGPEQVRVRIRALGETSDGRVWLVPERARVEGLFEPMPAYRPHRKEYITLLVRASAERAWRVAGWTHLGGNRTAWTISVADLNPTNADRQSERLAVATVSFKPFDPSQPVTIDMLNAVAISISDQKVFWLEKPGR